MARIPEITVAPDGDQFVLMATSYGHTSIVGPRILRGSGVLSIDVRHATKELAEQAAEKLRTYLATVGTHKKHRGEVVAEEKVKPHWEL